ILGAAAFMVATGRRLGLPPGHAAELAPIALLVHPRGLTVLQHGWTEPLLALAAAAAGWATAAARPRSLGLATAGLATLKQTGLLAAVGFARAGHRRWRGFVPGALAAASLLFAFFAWSP